MIGYHQPDLSSDRKRVMLEIEQCTRYGCIIGQYASCARAFVALFTVLTAVFMKAYNLWLVCFSKFRVVLVTGLPGDRITVVRFC